mmetsp:Transcript_9108/g.11387  ORF Transcript_9108/g.11387 Transcript_9108/m.11387 type:complete len:351 (-) Transcript_9108:80-1132(-)|eukprot:CAMPEP_0204831726 /NCGR_PEP_ID=MMETSP1346-20131115/11379_1 /ASSEMBLY_ACC=CAM_ASM_000771 /TAXON_ID=215587 /ORGANISM="Aplanochytrium stocchinoi, Strain GSBS06" /LENGTH=350 /DNA_ID=CAMNT_0051962973 /DNA_START=66 /DNA_END=1118 /DNA_ORIENTATION=+
MADLSVISIQVFSIWTSVKLSKWLNRELDSIYSYNRELEEIRTSKFAKFQREQTSNNEEEKVPGDKNDIDASGLRQRKKKKKKKEKRLEAKERWQQLEEEALNEVEAKLPQYQKTWLYIMFIGIHAIEFVIAILLVLNKNFFNYYSVLRLPPVFATPINIRRAYRNHQSQYDADSVEEAYQVLRDEERKLEYDLFGGNASMEEGMMQSLVFGVFWLFVSWAVASTSESREKVFSWGVFMTLLVLGYEFSVKILHWYNPIFLFKDIPFVNMLSAFGTLEIIKHVLFPALFAVCIVYQELTYEDPKAAFQWMLEIAEAQQKQIQELIGSLTDTCMERQKMIQEQKPEKNNNK